MDEALRRTLDQGIGVKPTALARALGLSRAGIYKAVERGEIPATRVGRRVIITAPVARRLLGMEPEGAGGR
jgi:excisionase family DNA binding protein